jgi:hypothetical protein
LQVLKLQHTRVSDAGLAHLRGLTELRLLVVYDTQVTDAGIRRLRQALPALQVQH